MKENYQLFITDSFSFFIFLLLTYLSLLFVYKGVSMLNKDMIYHSLREADIVARHINRFLLLKKTFRRVR